MICRSVSERGLVGDLFYAEAAVRRPAVIMLGGSEGGKSWSDNPYQKEMLADLVEAGLTVFSLAYFALEGLPKSLASIPLEYFETAFAWLAEQPEVLPHSYALVGGSKGAELALLLGSRYPEVRAVAAFAPSHVVFEGLSPSFVKTTSSWSYGGKELPYVSFPLTSIPAFIKGMQTGYYLQGYTIALRNTKQVKSASIPAENINGPVLLVSGSKDEMWPSALMAGRIMARLSEAKFVFPYEHLALETGHSIMEDEHCWPRVVGFLRSYAQKSPP